MPLGALKKSFVGPALAAGLSGLAALAPLSANADDAKPVAMTHDCGVMSAEICELDRMADAARAYAEENQSVAILFHVGDDVLTRDDSEQLMQKAQAYFAQQFASHDIEVASFARSNPGTPATGLTFHYGHLVFQGPDGRINLDLKEGIDAIPQVADQLNILRQTAQVSPAILEIGNDG